MRLWISVLMVLLTGGIAAGQPASAPEHTAGNEWTFTNGQQTWTTKVAKADGDTVVMTGALAACMTCLVYFDRNLTLQKVENPDGTSPDLARMGFVPVGPDWKYYNFPLEVKKEWRISAQAFARGAPRNFTVDCTVQSYEDVKTKAGTFKAFKIWRQWFLKGSEGSGEAR